LEITMASPEVYANPEKLAEVNHKFEKTKTLLESLQSNWEDVADQIDLLNA